MLGNLPDSDSKLAKITSAWGRMLTMSNYFFWPGGYLVGLYRDPCVKWKYPKTTFAGGCGMAPNSKTCPELIVLSRIMSFWGNINISLHTRHVLVQFGVFPTA